MDVQVQEKGNKKALTKDVSRVIIYTGADTQWRVEDRFGELIITKIDFVESAISIRPSVTNEIGLK